MSIQRLCKHCGCVRYRLPNSSFCEKHQADQAELDRKIEERKQKYFENRPRTSSQFYHTSRWKTERQNFLRENPYCHMCGGLATEVHHDWTTKDYLEDENTFFDVSHWIPLCHSCHTRISNSKVNRRTYEQ